MTKNNAIHENDNYIVSVGESLDYDGPTAKRLMYQIINKETGVVERENFALPYAIAEADSFDDLLRQRRAVARVVGAAKH